jgi:hypothetical protein
LEDPGFTVIRGRGESPDDALYHLFNVCQTRDYQIKISKKKYKIVVTVFDEDTGRDCLRDDGSDEITGDEAIQPTYVFSAEVKALPEG